MSKTPLAPCFFFFIPKSNTNCSCGCSGASAVPWLRADVTAFAALAAPSRCIVSNLANIRDYVIAEINGCF